MKKFALLLFLVALLLNGCMDSKSTILEHKTVVDALGRNVVINKNPSRIVIAGKQAPMLTNFLYLFQSTNQKLLAIEKRKQSGDDFLNLIDSKVGDKYILEKGAGAEQIAPLNPDLVILKSSMRESIGNQLETLSIPVIYVDFENIEQIYRDLHLFAEVLDEEKRGDELTSSYKMLFNKISEKINSNKGKTNSSVLILQASSEDQKYAFSIPAANWLQTDLVKKAGGNPVWQEANQAGSWVQINIEQISAWEADQIFIVNYQGEANKIISNLKNDPVWSNLKSSQTENIYAFPYDYQSWDQPDPRWILGYSWLAYSLNPGVFSADELESEILTFYENFFLLEKNLIQANISPRIRNILE